MIDAEEATTETSGEVEFDAESLGQVMMSLQEERRRLYTQLDQVRSVEQRKSDESRRLRATVERMLASNRQFCDELIARQREIESLREEIATCGVNEKCLLNVAERLEEVRVREAARAQAEREELLRKLAAFERQFLAMHPEPAEAAGAATNAEAAAESAGGPLPRLGGSWEQVQVPASEDSVEVRIVDGGAVGADVARCLTAGGRRAQALAADPYEGFALRPLPKAFAVNLAASGTWGGLRRLCAEHGFTDAPIVVYAMAAERRLGAWVGEVDFAILPLEDCRLAELLERRAPGLRRVMLVGHHPDLVQQVRTHLADAHISVSVVFDNRQAVEMFPVVQPQAVVVHLSPSCRGAFRIIGELRRSVAAGVPLVLVFDAAAQPEDVVFLHTGARELAERGRLAPTELAGACLATLARLLDQPAAPCEQEGVLHTRMAAFAYHQTAQPLPAPPPGARSRAQERSETWGGVG